MASGLGFQAKIKTVLQKLQPCPRLMQFRRVEQSGGNSRLGVGGTSTVTLTAIDPQPAVEDLPLPAVAQSEDIASATSLLQPGDYRFTFDGSIDESMFLDSQLLYGTEILNIVRVTPYNLFGVTAAYSVHARTVKTRA